MPDLNLNIDVEMSVTVGGQAAIKGHKIPIKVQALGCMQREIPFVIPPQNSAAQQARNQQDKCQQDQNQPNQGQPEKRYTAVSFLAGLEKAPDFFLVTPLTDKGDPATLEPGDLWWGVFVPEDKKHLPAEQLPEHTKPLTGPQVFFNGAVEWLTDLTKKEGKYNLPTLYFWNGTRKPIKVQIIVGYTPY